MARPLRNPMTKAERQARRDRCRAYLQWAGTLPAAVKLANAEGFRQNASVWLGALGELLAADEKRPG